MATSKKISQLTYTESTTNELKKRANNLQVVSNTGSYTLTLADQIRKVRQNSGGANNLTVPLNSAVPYPVGTMIAIRNVGAGITTIVAAGGVILLPSTGLTVGQYQNAVLHKVATDTWDVDISAAVRGGGTDPEPGNTTPAAPGFVADDDADTLYFTHALGTSELEVSINNGAYSAYAGTYNVGNVARAPGYYKCRVKAASGRNASLVTDSPAFNVASVTPTLPAFGTWLALFDAEDGLTNKASGAAPNLVAYPGRTLPSIEAGAIGGKPAWITSYTEAFKFDLTGIDTDVSYMLAFVVNVEAYAGSGEAIFFTTTDGISFWGVPSRAGNDVQLGNSEFGLNKDMVVIWYGKELIPGESWDLCLLVNGVKTQLSTYTGTGPSQLQRLKMNEAAFIFGAFTGVAYSGDLKIAAAYLNTAPSFSDANALQLHTYLADKYNIS